MLHFLSQESSTHQVSSFQGCKLKTTVRIWVASAQQKARPAARHGEMRAQTNFPDAAGAAGSLNGIDDTAVRGKLYT